MKDSFNAGSHSQALPSGNDIVFKVDPYRIAFHYSFLQKLTKVTFHFIKYIVTPSCSVSLYFR